MKSRLEISQWFESGWGRLYERPKAYRLKLKAWRRWMYANGLRIRAKRAAGGEEVWP